LVFITFYTFRTRNKTKNGDAVENQWIFWGEDGLGEVEHHLSGKARLRGYRDLIVGLEVTPTKGSNGYDEFVQRNHVAFAKLLISNENDVCLGLIESSKSKLMPEGDARLASTNLVQKFAPTAKSNLIKTKQKFVESKLDNILMDPDGERKA
jgi:hypothetical protein